ncbi:MAG: AAA family ATPase [Eubacterium sp.]|nr:AAA family ATPase [Eubacterium sp.]
MQQSLMLAKTAHFAYVTPELLLYVICQNEVFAQAFENCGGTLSELDSDLRTYLEEYVETDADADGEDEERVPEFTHSAGQLLADAWASVQNSGRATMELTHMVHAMYGLKESYAVYYMRAQGIEQAELLQEMIQICEEDLEQEDLQEQDLMQMQEDTKRLTGIYGREAGQPDIKAGAGKQDSEAKAGKGQRKEGKRGGHTGKQEEKKDDAKSRYWKRYAVCLNDSLEGRNPLIGRKKELERTMQVLCRKEKNNPLHIGEPGVGKTAIVYGFAKLLEQGQVPQPLLGAKVFSLDLGSLLAGTQYRGDFEKRLKKVMESISREEKPIVYMDEIHNIVGAGAVGGGSFDISNMLKPYLSEGHIRFIGATTFEEYKKHFEKSKSLVRRFQNIEVKEPDTADAVQILEGLRHGYEQFHGVRYESGTLEYAVEISAKYINERFLPDKAIDLIDEAGAYRRMHPLDAGEQTVGKELLDEIVSKICRIPKQVVETEETELLKTLEERLKNLVFGQDEAVSQVVNAVKFSRAGLLEEGKPLASLLFVGPTGVGKTEVAKSLAKELGVRLIRFDMSEYEEKHAVAKLIGAPAGYVGYEEGGLLTEEIRKTPHAVLLLDEIEKAHPDIYNILLQVMDAATLTDNQGRKADFRNVVIIMTSNAGASRIGKPGIGFLGEDTSADVVLEEVKRVFQPEFRNRLNKIVVFRGMDAPMAERIVEKKLGELAQMLLRKQVELTADAAAKKLILKKGVSAEYGAREIERVIRSEIKPLFVDEMLFGALKQGGRCVLTAAEQRFQMDIQ